MQFLDHKGINKIPRTKVITYARIILDYHAQKKGPQSHTLNCGGGGATQRSVSKVTYNTHL